MKELLENINAAYALLVLMAGGLVAFAVRTRGLWAKSRTNAVMEAAQQAGIASMVEALTLSQVREKQAWAMVASERAERDRVASEMGMMREEVASLRSEHADCEQRLVTFQASLDRLEERHEGERRMWGNRMHDMTNLAAKAGADLSATDVYGPKDGR